MSKIKSTPELFADAAAQGLATWKELQEASLRTAETMVGMSAAAVTKVPPVAQAVEAGFDIAAKALEQQRNYLVRLAEIWTQAPAKTG